MRPSGDRTGDPTVGPAGARTGDRTGARTVGPTAHRTGKPTMSGGEVDVVVVGSGPNGLAAAVTLAMAGLSVTVVEGADTTGGGCRTEALTLPGFRHDVCSTAHPMVLRPRSSACRRSTVSGPCSSSPRSPSPIPWTVVVPSPPSPQWRTPPGHWAPTVAPTVACWAPWWTTPASSATPSCRRCDRCPGTRSPWPGSGCPGCCRRRGWWGRFGDEPARALLAGVSAHSMAPLTSPLTGAFGLFLTLIAHAAGWPVVEGGSSAITDAMVDELERLGGTVVTGQWVRSLAELPAATAVVVDASPRGLAAMAGDTLPARYGRSLGRFRYGPGVCKVDWALSGPVPWRAEVCRRAGTLHLGARSPRWRPARPT